MDDMTCTNGCMLTVSTLSGRITHQGMFMPLLPHSCQPSPEHTTLPAPGKHLQGRACCNSQLLPLLLRLSMHQQESL